MGGEGDPPAEVFAMFFRGNPWCVSFVFGHLTHSSAATESTAPKTEERRSRLDRRHTERFVEELFGDDLHAKRVLSLSNAVVGVLRAAVLSVHAIGQAYADQVHVGGKAQCHRVRVGGAVA